MVVAPTVLRNGGNGKNAPRRVVTSVCGDSMPNFSRAVRYVGVHQFPDLESVRWAQGNRGVPATASGAVADHRPRRPGSRGAGRTGSTPRNLIGQQLFERLDAHDLGLAPSFRKIIATFVQGRAARCEDSTTPYGQQSPGCGRQSRSATGNCRVKRCRSTHALPARHGRELWSLRATTGAVQSNVFT